MQTAFQAGIYRAPYPYLYRAPKGYTEAEEIQYYIDELNRIFDEGAPAGTIGGTFCGNPVACAYPLGSVYHIPHGQSNQLMFKDVMEKYREIQPSGKINDLEDIIGTCLGVAQGEALPALYELMDKVLKKEPLRNFGVKKSDLPVFAEDVIKTQQRLLENNYVELSEEQVLEIYKAAY